MTDLFVPPACFVLYDVLYLLIDILSKFILYVVYFVINARFIKMILKKPFKIFIFLDISKIK